MCGEMEMKISNNGAYNPNSEKKRYGHEKWLAEILLAEIRTEVYPKDE
jgi:hypothetical protein